LTLIIAFAFLVSFFGASHDIVIDAYRRDILDEDELGFGSAVSTNSYLIGFRFLTTVLGLALADFTSWQNVFLFFGVLCGLGMIGTFIAPKPAKEASSPKNIKDAIILPFLNYLTRPGALEILLFILLYKVGDNFAANLLTTFYLKIGFAKTEIAGIGKLVGFWATFTGTFIGGFFLLRFSIRRCLLWFGAFQAVSTLGFAFLNEAILANSINRLVALGMAVGFENLTAGMGTAAFSAFMLKLSDRRFSATQYALLTSFMGIPRVVIPGWAGYVAEPLGWTQFFVFSTFIAAPGLLMVYFRGKKWEESLPT
jgi:PAT family beta-lactamase induction signal transducer AmpG